MRFRTIFLSFLFILTLCLVLTISTAMASVTDVTDMGDGSVVVRWDSNDDYRLVIVWKTGNDYDAEMSRYGYYWLPLDEGKNRQTVYIFAPGQSYWVQTLNWGSGFTTPVEYNAGRAYNFNEFSHPPKFSLFELKMRDSAGKMSNVDYFLASDLEDPNNYNSYGVRFQFTWPTLAKSRTYLWQFVLEFPDGYKLVDYHELVNMPVGGYFWKCDYEALENQFHAVYDMRGEVPIGQYKYSVYWNGQHVASCDFWVR